MRGKDLKKKRVTEVVTEQELKRAIVASWNWALVTGSVGNHWRNEQKCIISKHRCYRTKRRRVASNYSTKIMSRSESASYNRTKRVMRVRRR